MICWLGTDCTICVEPDEEGTERRLPKKFSTEPSALGLEVNVPTDETKFVSPDEERTPEPEYKIPDDGNVEDVGAP